MKKLLLITSILLYSCTTEPEDTLCDEGEYEYYGQCMSNFNCAEFESLDECYNFVDTTIVDTTNLTILNLAYNQLTGEIPSWIENLTNLQFLSLSNNQLTGEIPSWIGNLTNLGYLILDNNQFTGEIPEIDNLMNLIHLRLDNNQLTGEIPSWIGNLTNLGYLRLDNNQLTGEIPQSVCNLIENNQLNINFVLNGNNLTNTCE